jgi:membrane protein YqaA with SNARE-associated domain
VAIAALAKVPVPNIALAMFIGRIVRYGVYTWLIAHARQGLSQFFRKDQ